jgi:hypothetical protein
MPGKNQSTDGRMVAWLAGLSLFEIVIGISVWPTPLDKRLLPKEANVGKQTTIDIFRVSYRSYGKMCGEGSRRFQSRKCQPLPREARRSFRVAGEPLLPAGSRYAAREFRRFPLGICGQITRTHGRPARQSADRKFALKVVCHPGEKISKTPTAARLSHQCRTELGLPSGTPQKDDHHLCDLQGERSAQVVFNQREGQVDSGSHASRSEKILVSDIDRPRINFHFRMLLLQFLTPIPMSGHAPTVQQSGLSQNQRARAN